MFLTTLLLAMVQGATEFLPVSSTGHLVVLTQNFGLDSDPLRLAAELHTATALAAVIHYRREYRHALRGFRAPGPEREFVRRYIGAQVVTVLVAMCLAWLLTQTGAAQWRDSLWLTGAMMLCNGAVLLVAPRRKDEPAKGVLPGLTWRMAVWVGMAQGIAALPGLSRSGLTIVAGLRSGLAPRHAASLSFLLAPPVILASALFWSAQFSPDSAGWFTSWRSVFAMLIVALVGFLLASAGLRWVASWARAGRLWWFAPWSLVAGVAALTAAAW